MQKKCAWLRLGTSVLLISWVLALSGCSSHNAISTPQNFTRNYLLDDMRMFSINGSSAENEMRNWFFRDYKALVPNLRIHSGLFPSEGQLLAAHMLTGEDVSKGTAILIHGYKGSVTNTHFEYLAKELIPRGFRVILLNLPGHEFSGGYRGAIENFDNYGIMLRDFIAYTQGALGSQVVLVGHSVGAITIYDALSKYEEVLAQEHISAIVMLAPFYDLNGSTIFSGASYMVKELQEQNIDNNVMLEYTYPTSWIRFQSEWTKDLNEYGVLENDNAMLLVGTDDMVIKLDKTLEYFQRKMPRSKIEIYEGQNHTFSLLNVPDSYLKVREDMLAWILSNTEL